MNEEEYFTKLIGEYNIYNVSIVRILLKILNIDYINSIIKELNSPSGRMDIIKYKGNKI